VASLMGTAMRLSTSLDALAALAAHLRVETEQVEVSPQVRELLAQVAEEVLGAPEAEDATAGPAVVGFARAFLRLATDLIESPGRVGGWVHVDEALLQGIGRGSASIVEAFRAAEPVLDGLGERMAAGSAFLDVGTGTAWLAMATARIWPAARVVGIDVYEPSLALARSNVAEAGLDRRVELRLQDVTTLDEEAVYDAIWLPMPFLPAEIVPAAMAASARALRPGGWLLPGTFAGPDDRLSRLLVDLRTVRSGGYPWRPDELVETIAAHGFTGAREVPRTWTAPVRLYAGRRP